MQQLLVGSVMLATSAVVVLNQQHQVQVQIQVLVPKEITALLAQANQKNVQRELTPMCSTLKMQTGVKIVQKGIIVESLGSETSLDNVTLDSTVSRDQRFLILRVLQNLVDLAQ